jgi:hypothetical protein
MVSNELKELKSVLRTRKKYVNEHYVGRDKEIALFEVDVLFKIVNKAFDTEDYKESISDCNTTVKKRIRGTKNK